MEVNAKSVLSTTFQLGTFPMPIRLYKTTDTIGLSGHLFHEGCGGKIRQWKTCEDHPNTEDPATFSGIPVGGRIVRLTNELKSQLFDGDTKFETVGVYGLSRLPVLIAEQNIVPMDAYEMAPEQYFEKAYSTLLDRLRVRKQFLLTRYSANKMKRYGLLFHTGILTPIRYCEEVRPKRFEPTTPDRQFARRVNDELNSLEDGDFPKLSAESMLDAVQQWFTNIALDRKIVAYKSGPRVSEKEYAKKS